MLPFAKTKALESQVDEFLDIIVQGVLTLRQAIKAYLEDREDEFTACIQKVSKLESAADEIRKRTETALYTFSLIPESRGDVLGLLENLDNVVDSAKAVVSSFEVQRPQIPTEYHARFLELNDLSIQAVENVVLAGRSYFRDVKTVPDHINKVDFYESEADRIGLALKKMIFDSELDLSHKMHLRYFAERIESISDIAEHVAERLNIAAIKRSI